MQAWIYIFLLMPVRLNGVVTNGTFRFITTTEIFVFSRKISNGNTPNFHSPGVVFQNKGEHYHERQTGNLYDNKGV